MSTPETKATGREGNLPPFYREPIILQYREHADAGLIRKVDMSFASHVTATPICVGEFAAASFNYPIVFTLEESPTPMAILGINKGQNLLIDDAGRWRYGFYVPAYLRRYPFIAANIPQAGEQLLAIDRACSRFVPAIGEESADRFFEAGGSPSALARSAMQLCHAVIEDQQRTEAFTSALADQGLLTETQARFRLPDQTQCLVDGFRLIDASSYRNIPAPLIERWHRDGWLDLVVLQQASQKNWATLLRLNNEVSPSKRSVQ